MTKARDLADLLDASGNIIAQGTVDGRDLASDGSKLDSIEHGATGDQTHSEIRALIEVGVDTNVFTDADHTKLDGIEANATADQTAAEIRALVESATDSNVFTDADHTKLNGIESGATADQTKADIDALNIDADTLDGQHGSYYTGYTDTAVANLVASAPGTLDTLNELAAALGDDPNFATTTATNIGTKANKTITVSAGSGLTGGGDLTANRTISHADTSSVSDVNGSGNTFIQDIGFDTYGHVTSVGTGTVTVGDGAMTVTAGSGLTGGGQLGTANQSGASSVSLSVTDAPKWTTARTLSLTGDASGSTSWDGSGNASISVTVADDSHNHVISNVDGLQTALDGKLSTSGKAADSNLLDGLDSTAFVRSKDRTNWNTSPSVIGDVIGQLAWKNYSNNHTIFDASASTTPNGGSCNNTNSDYAWSGAYPTLMGWNGSNTYGVRVDSARNADNAALLGSLPLTSQTRNSQANSVVRTQSNGYCEFGWINTVSGDTSSSLSRIFVDTGDGYIRKSTLAHVASQLPISAGAPAGSIIYHAASSAPSGFIKANGASLSTSTYADLFAAIGYTYGGSGGSFNVPDLRGEFLRGWDDSRGVDSGRSFGSYQADEFKSHSHTLYTNGQSGGMGGGGFPVYYNPFTRSTSSTGGSETRPRNIALLACIKY